MAIIEYTHHCMSCGDTFCISGETDSEAKWTYCPKCGRTLITSEELDKDVINILEEEQ